MGRRISTNPLWLLCCCSCLGPLSIIKGAIGVGPVLLVVLLAHLFIGLFYWIQLAPLVVWSILTTSTWGWRLKIISLLVGVWVPIALFLPVVIVYSLGIGLYYGLFGVVQYTFNDEYWAIGGWGALASDVGGLIVSFQTYLAERKEYLYKWRTRALFPTEEPWDLHYFWLLICLLVGVFGILVVLPIWLILATIKLIPAMMRAYYTLWRAFFEELGGVWIAILSPVFFVANALLPAACIMLYVFTIFHGLVAGVYSSIVCYEEDSLVDAFQYMIAVLRRFDFRTNQVFLGHFWCIEKKSFFDLCCCKGLDKVAKIRVDWIVIW